MTTKTPRRIMEWTRDQDALLIRLIGDGKNRPEVARRLGCSVQQVSSRKQKLSEQGTFVPDFAKTTRKRPTWRVDYRYETEFGTCTIGGDRAVTDPHVARLRAEGHAVERVG